METFHKREGTTNKEVDFENVHIANFVLQLVSNPNIEDFHLSSNDERYDVFGDIVVEIGYKRGKDIYVLQLQHEDKQTLALESLTQSRGDFEIVKYFETFQKCDDATQKFILFTNLKFEVKDNQPFQLEGEDFDVTLSKFYPEDEFKISEETNYCYKFTIVEDASTSQNSARTRQYKTFFNNFFLYVDQKNVTNLKVSTEKKFNKMFLSNELEFENYLKMISEWSQQEGKKEKLNKKWMQRAIATLLLSSRTQPLSFAEVNENRKILRQAISDFDITVFEKNSNRKLSELWGDAKQEIEDLEEINSIRIKYQLSSTHIDNLDNVDPKLLSQLLWIMGKCPLIVTEDQTVYKAIKLCLKDKFIVLGNGLIQKWQRHFSVFQDLLDLQRKSNFYKDVMKNFTCSLQGKEEMSLQVLFNESQEVLDAIKTDDLLEMLDGPCNIGSEKEDLPNPYIDRFLLRNVIDVRYLKTITEDTLVILNCGTKLKILKRILRHHKFIDIDHYLSEGFRNDLSNEENIFGIGRITSLKISLKKSGYRSTIYLSKDECNLKKFQAACDKNKEAKNCHQFRYRDDGNLDWIRSKNDFSDLEKYKVFNEFVEEKILWSLRPDNNINVIIGDPGIGKTELMRSLKNNCSSVFWTVVVSPKNIYFFLKNLENRDNFVEAFKEFISNEKSKSFKTLDKDIFKTFIKQNRVIYVWDALDEISSNHLEDVTDIILQLSQKSLPQWVTSRQHLKKFLESKFNVLSITIDPFTNNEQGFYIKKRLAANSKKENEEIINKIQSSPTLVDLRHVLGIPLQIYMLTELFRQNRKKYLDLLNNVFVPTDLYHYFMEERTSIHGIHEENFLFEDLLKWIKQRTLEDYEKFALKALLPEDILSRLNINCKTELQSLQLNNSGNGIIRDVTNEIPSFLHASFAEYLVAVYFSKHLVFNDILIEIIFQQKYVNIRFFLDWLLAKTFPKHFAILYKDIDFLKKCDKKILKREDAGGRSLLQLACYCGQKHPPLNVEESAENTYLFEDVNDYAVTAEAAEYLDMIECLPDECNIPQNETCFYVTPLFYDQKRDYLFGELTVIPKQKTQLSRDDSAGNNILYYSSRYEYGDALDLSLAKNLPFIKTGGYEYSLLNLACGHKAYILKLFIQTYIYENQIHDGGGTDASNNFQETTAILIEYEPQINVEENDGAAPPLITCLEEIEKTVEILMKSGDDIKLAWNHDVTTPLFIAVLSEHKRIVTALIQSGADINSTGSNGVTPLLLAGTLGCEEIVEILIESGADINLALNNGATPLLMASRDALENIAEILMKSGADINLATNDGVTPLLYASAKGHQGIVEMLIKSGAGINLVTNDGTTPLFTASQTGHEKIAEILLKSGADINLAINTGATPLFIASQIGHKKIVEILIKSGAYINLEMNSGATPLFIACEKGHDEIVELLIKSEAGINLVTNDRTTPLFIASKMGHEKIAEILIKFGADINLATNTGATPLFIASQTGHEKIVEILIKSGADINLEMNNGDTPLYIASEKGHNEIVELLIKSGAGINHVTNDGTTPLFIASQMGHEKIAEILAKSGADPNLTRSDDVTPLFIASQKGVEEIAEILIKSGAKVNLADRNGFTPIFIASLKGHKEIVEILIESGADINLATKMGTTPLFIACQMGHAIIFEILITSGADINLSKNDYDKLLSIASQKGHREIVEILKYNETYTNFVKKDVDLLLQAAVRAIYASRYNTKPRTKPRTKHTFSLAFGYDYDDD